MPRTPRSLLITMSISTIILLLAYAYVIRHHHEKWDGTGYPDKLKDTEIPLFARILAIADVYDALTSRRSYREPWSQERALQVIVEGSGTHFDPECVSAFVRLCHRGALVVPEAIGQSYGRTLSTQGTMV